MKGLPTVVARELKLSNTVELRNLSKEESKPDAFKERLASWQDRAVVSPQSSFFLSFRAAGS